MQPLGHIQVDVFTDLHRKGADADYLEQTGSNKCHSQYHCQHTHQRFLMYSFFFQISFAFYCMLPLSPICTQNNQRKTLKCQRTFFVTNLPPNSLSSLCADGLVYLPPLFFLVYNQFCRILPILLDFDSFLCLTKNTIFFIFSFLHYHGNTLLLKMQWSFCTIE